MRLVNPMSGINTDSMTRLFEPIFLNFSYWNAMDNRATTKTTATTKRVQFRLKPGKSWSILAHFSFALRVIYTVEDIPINELDFKTNLYTVLPFYYSRLLTHLSSPLSSSTHWQCYHMQFIANHVWIRFVILIFTFKNRMRLVITCPAMGIKTCRTYGYIQNLP